MLKIGLLCSGQLGHRTLAQLTRPVEFVMTDRGSRDVIEYCREHSVAVFVGNPRGGRAQSFITDRPVDVIASVNYLFIVEQDVIEHPRRLAFNIHGSLLPKYRGRTPHVWAIINGEEQVGITAHKIVPECDAGDVIEQIVIPLNGEETGAEMLNRYGDEYGPLVERVLKAIESDTINLTKQDESEATWFGKRTPTDGEIDWSWSSERIRNWVRAQADPYPGAFTWLQGMKVTIDQVSISDLQHDEHHDMHQRNGTILVAGASQPVVKTTDGAVRLEVVRETELELAPGIVLGQLE